MFMLPLTPSTSQAIIALLVITAGWWVWEKIFEGED